MSRLRRDQRLNSRGDQSGPPASAVDRSTTTGDRRRASRARHPTTPVATNAEPQRDDASALSQGGCLGVVPEQKKRNEPHRAVDAARLTAVDTRAVGSHARSQDDGQVTASASSPMEKEHFGNCLRRAREKRAISLSDVAQRTKVSRALLELLEKGDLDLLPASVYSRGFIRSFARAIGADENEPLSLYERAVEARNVAEKARVSTPVLDPREVMAQANQADDEATAPRRGVGLAVFVIILLLIATITLSLLLRRPPPSGEGLSWLGPLDRSTPVALRLPKGTEWSRSGC